MSHVAVVEVKITDLDSFETAVKSLGGTLHRGQKTYRWFGRFVGDSPMPKGMTTADLGKCDHAASFPGCKYEVGLRANADGSFNLAYDYWGDGGLAKALGGKDIPRLRQAYSVEKVKTEAYRFGHVVESEERMQDGSIRVRLLAAR